ncbi:hypothetical protein MHZ95_08285 [Sporosarcina sp. ACRSM]|uniref:hypothetical protein n=1 Tax=Sporosarcina sp. ACRSM TaxID=2918216 RepID=UPI001EF69810|nr:hypothetical protein [Sporosarcina sp. ACRSM]MCG7335272.1 hypothetical protein [Sporosarcina sp. ACRSM]
MNKPSVIGKNHVLHVSHALKRSLIGDSLDAFSDPVVQTVNFIKELYPNIQSVKNKFETVRPDAESDLVLRLTDQQEIKINLFLIKGSANIQPKNLGAKSFLEKYFGSTGLQTYFNDHFNREYLSYLQGIISLKENLNAYDRISVLKKKVGHYYSKFEEEINPYRTEFLFSLREYCFILLKDEYNVGAEGIQHAFNELMLIDSTTIITRHSNGSKCLGVEHWKSNIDSNQGIQIYKKGNDTIGIRSGEEALTLRFKFESGPTSSVKLATSYEVFPAEDKIEQRNLRSIENFEMLIEQHIQLETTNKSNAIGKCNEAMVYYGILKAEPSVLQVDEQEYRQMLNTYSPIISHKELLDLQRASTITMKKIFGFLEGKYSSYQIESIQLVANNYVLDRLDTSDLQLVLRVDQKYVVESFSLKAISKRNTKITTKNPGIGTILGPQYFDIGSLALFVEEVKKQFEQELLTHREALEKVSEELGESLQVAQQEYIRKGIAALLGNSTMVLTIYSQNDSLVLEYGAIKDEIEVLPKTPTAIQTSLRWNDNQEELTLRVKFSGGQNKGWSSLKLACDYRITKNSP